MTQLNMDKQKSLAIAVDDLQWEASPASGVWRKKLMREGAESGIATSVVKYDAGSAFSSHAHPGGEEILVLQGTFCDEHGQYRAGTYFRNPPGTSHAPSSPTGCILFVKLCHFLPGDALPVSVFCPPPREDSSVSGVSTMSLHQFKHESTIMFTNQSLQSLPIDNMTGNIEWFVVAGELAVNNTPYQAWSWGRSPADEVVRFLVGPKSQILIKKQEAL